MAAVPIFFQEFSSHLTVQLLYTRLAFLLQVFYLLASCFQEKAIPISLTLLSLSCNRVLCTQSLLIGEQHSYQLALTTCPVLGCLELALRPLQ